MLEPRGRLLLIAGRHFFLQKTAELVCTRAFIPHAPDPDWWSEWDASYQQRPQIIIRLYVFESRNSRYQLFDCLFEWSMSSSEASYVLFISETLFISKVLLCRDRKYVRGFSIRPFPGLVNFFSCFPAVCFVAVGLGGWNKKRKWQSCNTAILLVGRKGAEFKSIKPAIWTTRDKLGDSEATARAAGILFLTRENKNLPRVIILISRHHNGRWMRRCWWGIFWRKRLKL